MLFILSAVLASIATANIYYEPLPQSLDFSEAEVERLKVDEGFRAQAYPDGSGESIGYGTFLPFTPADLNCFDGHEVNIVTTKQGDCLLRIRLTQYVNDLKVQWVPFDLQPQVVKDALSNMAYNLGAPKLLRFVTMLSLLAEHKYEEAADDALNTLWAHELSGRAHRLIAQIRSAGD